MRHSSDDDRRAGLSPAACVAALAVFCVAAAAGAPGNAAAAAADGARVVPGVAAGAARVVPGAAAQRGLRIVAIDPGHGGSETGAIGPSGISEKEIALDIASRLRDLLVERVGLQVFLTRQGDYDVPLERRTEQANNMRADVFVSIHVNAYRGSGVRGAETFFLSDRATDDEARRLAALENDAMELSETTGGDSGLQLLLWDMAQTMHLRESEALAATIQTRLNRMAGTGDRGVKQAPFRVLRGATMPAVLVEVGFLSNPDEEAMLSSPTYRQRIAEELFTALEAYRQRQIALSGGSQR